MKIIINVEFDPEMWPHSPQTILILTNLNLDFSKGISFSREIDFEIFKTYSVFILM